MIVGIVVLYGAERPTSSKLVGFDIDGGLVTVISDSPTTLKLFCEQRGHGWFTCLLFKASIACLNRVLSMRIPLGRFREFR